VKRSDRVGPSEVERNEGRHLKSRGYYFLHESVVKRSDRVGPSEVERNEGRHLKSRGYYFLPESVVKRSDRANQWTNEIGIEIIG